MLTVEAKLHEAVTFDEIEHSVLLDAAEAMLEDLQEQVDGTSPNEIEQLELDIGLWTSIIDKLQQAKQIG
jgi:hypothetical protein